MSGLMVVQYNFQSIAIALIAMKDRYPQRHYQEALLLCIVFAGQSFITSRSRAQFFFVDKTFVRNYWLLTYLLHFGNFL
jgi:hypothetical protein